LVNFKDFLLFVQSATTHRYVAH